MVDRDQNTLPDLLSYQLTVHPWEFSRAFLGSKWLSSWLQLPSLQEWIDDTLLFSPPKMTFITRWGIRIVILLRFCWIGVYCFDLCNNTYFFEWLHVPFLQGIWSDEGQGASGEGEGCWRKGLEWQRCGFWPSRPGICTLVTKDILWLYTLTLQRLKGKPELHVAGN